MHFVGFPTLEDAIKYRDETQAERLRFKTMRENNAIREKEKALLAKFSADEYPHNILKAIECEEYEKFYQSVFDNCLNDREKDIVTRFYEGKETLQEIGKSYGVTKERIRQICVKAQSKIRNGLYLAKRQMEHEFRRREWQESNEKLEQWREKIFAEFQKTHEYNEDMIATFGMITLSNVTAKNDEGKTVADIPLEEMDLSIRSYNCLKRAGIKTMFQILDKTYDDMLHVRNLGKKSLKEIIAKLAEKGLSLREF